LIATGYESSLLQSATDADGTTVEWTERVMLIHSPVYEQQQQGDSSNASIATKLKAPTPPAGRGKRQIRELEVLQHKAQTILKSHRVEGLLATYEHYPATKTVGERYQITAVTLNTAANRTNKPWLACLCHQRMPEQLSFQDAVLTYRDQWILSEGSIASRASRSATPFFVQRDDQLTGLVHLLSLGLRILTLIEFVVRRQRGRFSGGSAS